MAQSHHHLTEEEFQSFRPPQPQYEEFQNMEFLTHLSEHIPSVPVTDLNFHNSFSDDSFISGNQEFPGISVSDNFPTVLQQNCYGFVSNYNIKDVPKVEMHEQRKRKAVEIYSSSTAVASVFDQGSSRKHSSGNAKRKKSVQKEDAKRREVVHVRARRGQATDSHSLAERVRRGKINERLKCLQGIVPGCYKTMGMAMMLDEIINYVQSLQNQVEFLSMKLNAASSFYDFNTESDTIDKMQRAMVGEAKEMERRIPTWHP